MIKVWSICLLSISVCFSQLEFSGFVDHYFAAKIRKGEWNALRSRLRGEISTIAGDSWLFASFNATHNQRLPDETGIELREAFMEYSAEHWDLRMGRQIISWGKADGIRITDLICPADYTEFITRDFDDIRIPVNMIKTRYLSEWVHVEFLWLPAFSPTILPTGDNPWAVSQGLSEEFFALSEAQKPELSLENSEVASRISFYLSGIDFAFSAFYTWSDIPVLTRAHQKDSVWLEPEYYRMTFYGAEMTLPWNQVVLRTEAAWYRDQRFVRKDVTGTFHILDQLKGLVGLDWYPGNDWTFTMQFAQDYILHYRKELEHKQRHSTATLRIAKKFLRQTLELSNMLYAGVQAGDFYDQLAIDYALTDALHLSGGLDVFGGKDSGEFGQYSDNTQFWCKGKYSF